VSVTSVDHDWAHLWPPFAAKVKVALQNAPGGPWRLVEGFRSQARQEWLYAQGRTRPGPIVTWTRVTPHHGAGLAADVIPAAGYDAPEATWWGLRKAWKAEGLENPVFSRGDVGHIQWPASDLTTHRKALAWVRAGFKPVTPQPTEIPVHVGADLIEDADAYRDPASGRVYVALRPVTDALGYVIAEVRDRQALVVDDDGEMTVPVHQVGGRGFVWSRDLAPLTDVQWDPAKGLLLADL
jgi:hypothetical protein